MTAHHHQLRSLLSSAGAHLHAPRYHIFIPVPFCHKFPICSQVAEDDFSKTILTVVGAKVEVVHLNKIRTEGQDTYTASNYLSPGHQAFEDHKSAIVDAKISPDGSG